ncbi:diacylglycerol/lipid kinase family protein [Nitriliruptor alkaliphilus]|uniref:diacylglycerol/lipid kinase family protein n=1 Tax=Nitriliruptor alkaliphilus TaxID=427918 RepID=UPI000696F737|nr:diacylglycerol kinase family protein [Nitriliruptor alkaliphilus]
MRALLVFNPNATTTDEHVRDVIASALASTVDLEVEATKQRGHATHLVAGAVHEGFEAVFALGGDGTANEVLQALAGTDVQLGIIPGGGANVLARALGLPNDAVEATAVLLDHLRAGRSRRITLGRAGERYFGFNAGYGFDAAVVRHVEQHPARKRRFKQGAFVWSTTREWFVGARRDDTQVTVRTPDGASHGPFALTLLANTDPYTFLGPRPMHVHPQATFDTGLDLLAIAPVGTPSLLRILSKAFADGGHVALDGVRYWHDLDGFTLTSTAAQPLMVDGDYAGEHREVTFTAVRDALRVLA